MIERDDESESERNERTGTDRRLNDGRLSIDSMCLFEVEPSGVNRASAFEGVKCEENLSTRSAVGRVLYFK